MLFDTLERCSSVCSLGSELIPVSR